MTILLSSAPHALAVSALAEKTERSPLLYAWWALNLLVLAGIGYAVHWSVRKWRAGRRPRG
ncbi:hypothetical protein [Streptomyces mobaraensis]|uniref:Uncharacterized protein n=1 Tax=Streptomyces mobaraensis TaxID=35621 RepID=A0A5N5WEV4_STRMB|nr:hypothetical protein [Streptomyces mobaraensis]KAB7850275.1 hypothetical protein FRZ00_06715 [Streptomyces mobaraensis]